MYPLPVLPPLQIDTGAPFAVAFTQLGKPWAATIVSIGAVLSITDTLLVVIYGMSRTFVVLGRFHLIPQAMVRRGNKREGGRYRRRR
jgi:APA family basic amino acid/polyamine antiporter